MKAAQLLLLAVIMCVMFMTPVSAESIADRGMDVQELETLDTAESELMDHEEEDMNALLEVDQEQGTQRRRRWWRRWRPPAAVAPRIIVGPPTYRHIPLNQAQVNAFAHNERTRETHSKNLERNLDSATHTHRTKVHHEINTTDKQTKDYLGQKRDKLQKSRKALSDRLTKEAIDVALDKGKPDFDALAQKIKESQTELARHKARLQEWTTRKNQVQADKQALTESFKPILKGQSDKTIRITQAIAEFELESKDVEREMVSFQKTQEEFKSKMHAIPKEINARVEVERQARVHPGFKFEADGSKPKTRTLELGKAIDASTHGKFLIKDKFRADFASINRADLLNGAAKDISKAVREDIHEITMAETPDVSPTIRTAEAVMDFSFIDAEDMDLVEEEEKEDAEAEKEMNALFLEVEDQGMRRRRWWRRWRPAPVPLGPIIHRPGPVITVDPNTHHVSTERANHVRHVNRRQHRQTRYNNEIHSYNVLRNTRLTQLKNEKINTSAKLDRENVAERKRIKTSIPKVNDKPHLDRMAKARATLKQLQAEEKDVVQKADAAKQQFEAVTKETDKITNEGDSKIKQTGTEAGLLLKKIEEHVNVATKVVSTLEKYD